MPDTKITALAAITTVDPAADVLPIVDISDTSMAASGTTKKITSNQILGAGGTATLASATITGDLTVDTSTLKVDSANNRVGINTASPALPFVVSNAGAQGFEINPNGSIVSGGIDILSYNRSTSLYKGAGFAAESYLFRVGTVSATDAMTLNSTGLGVGGSPLVKLSVVDTVNTFAATFRGNLGTDIVAIGTTALGASINAYTAGFGAATNLVLQPNGGNVGIGVTPSAWGAGGNIQGTNGFIWSSYDASVGAGYYYASGSYKYISTAAASIYQPFGGTHKWFTAAGGQPAGTNFTPTQAMTLDASGNLLVGSALPVSGGRISGNSSTGPAGRFFSSAGDNQFAAMFDKSSATNTTSQWLIGFTINNQATGSGQINANGASQAAFGTFSDSRLKENIVSLPSQLANILSLRPVEFDYKDGSGHQIGFVAQEMQEVYSDAVGEQNGFLTVTGWSKTEARLVSAIKELAAKVQALEAKLA